MTITDQTTTDPLSADLRRSKRPRRDKQDLGAEELNKTKRARDQEKVLPKQTRRLGKVETKEKEEVAAEPLAPSEDRMEVVAVGPTPVLLRMPAEVWQHVLFFLATSHVAQLSLVSTLFFNVCRSWPRWRTICHVSKLGEPKKKYRSHMALVCSESYYICDLCDSRSTGTGSCGLAGIPLAVSREDDQGHWWRLCRSCRIEYYRKFSATTVAVLSEIDPKDEISEYDIFRELKLKHSELETFPSRPLDPITTFYSSENTLFNKREVTGHAMAVHGGWVGAVAAKNRLSYDILVKYKERKAIANK